MSKRFFVSYDYEGDRDFVNSLMKMFMDPNINIDFYDETIIEPIGSINAVYIKSRIRDMMSKANFVLCVIGENTHNSKWVRWEIRAAMDLGKQIIFMRRDGDTKSLVSEYLLCGEKIHNWNIDLLKKM